MELRQLRQFVEVARLGSFRRAAEHLHIAQPPLSVSIRRLEDELGAELFVRSRRGVRLSDAGQLLLDDATRAVFYADQFRKSAASAASGLSGTLRVGFVGSATYTLLPSLLPRFRAQYPLITLELAEGTTTTILAAVERGDLDAGLVRYPVIESHAVSMTVVEPDVLVAAMHESNPLSRRRQLRFKDLADQDFVLYSSKAASNLRAQVMIACQSAGFTPRVVQEAVQVQTVVSLVESGLGIALVPSACSRHASRAVTFKQLAESPEYLDVAIALAVRQASPSRSAQHFARFIAAEVAAGTVGSEIPAISR